MAQGVFTIIAAINAVQKYFFVHPMRGSPTSCIGLEQACFRMNGRRRSRIHDNFIPVISDTQSLLAHARVALVKSGTTTLEATLQGTPFVTVYRTHPLTYLLARLLVNVDYIALPNLLMEKEVVPEVLQGSARPGHLANLLGPLFDMESDVRIRMIKNLSLVRGRLGNPGASERVASLAKFVLEKNMIRKEKSKIK